jgi:hypothetical protein
MTLNVTSPRFSTVKINRKTIWKAKGKGNTNFFSRTMD